LVFAAISSSFTIHFEQYFQITSCGQIDSAGKLNNFCCSGYAELALFFNLYLVLYIFGLLWRHVF